MAAKIHMMKFLQEVRGYGLVTSRHPSPRLETMYSLQLQSHVAETTFPARRRIAISVNPADTSNQARAVRIVQVVGR